jgi:hypothetical protein
MPECFSGLKGQNRIAQGRVSGVTNRNATLGNEEEKVKPSARPGYSKYKPYFGRN